MTICQFQIPNGLCSERFLENSLSSIQIGRSGVKPQSGGRVEPGSVSAPGVGAANMTVNPRGVADLRKGSFFVQELQ